MNYCPGELCNITGDACPGVTGASWQGVAGRDWYRCGRIAVSREGPWYGVTEIESKIYEGAAVVSLENISLFAGLSASELEAISKLAVTRTFQKNTMVLCEGEQSDSMYVVQSGKVKVFLSDEDGKEVTLNLQGEGEYFGELALLDEAPRSASVVTVEDTRLTVISKAAFDRCMAHNPEIALKVIRGLARRLRELTENVRSLALMDVYGRVARVLLEMAEEKDGKKVIPQRLTQRDIASMVGASREMVSRILRDLTEGGYISIKSKVITINERLPAAW